MISHSTAREIRWSGSNVSENLIKRTMRSGAQSRQFSQRVRDDDSVFLSCQKNRNMLFISQ